MFQTLVESGMNLTPPGMRRQASFRFIVCYEFDLSWYVYRMKLTSPGMG